MHAAILTARLIHIVTGVYWAGSVIFIGIFLGPVVAASGPSGTGVMQGLARRRHFEFTVGAATLTVLSGFYLVWIDSGHLDPTWFRSSFGQGISLGMACAVVAYLVGVFVTRPTLVRVSALGAQMGQGAPSPDLAREFDAARSRLIMLSKITVALLVLAVSAMAVARYL